MNLFDILYTLPPNSKVSTVTKFVWVPWVPWVPWDPCGLYNIDSAVISGDCSHEVCKKSGLLSLPSAAVCGDL